MKVWFFKEKWKSSNGWKISYNAVIAQNCYMTTGNNLAETIYWAHDLIACVKEDLDSEKIYDEPFEYLNDGIFETDSREFYIGSLDIDVEIKLHPYSWRRKKDKISEKPEYMRFRMLKRAFQLSYKNFKLND